MSPCHHVPMSSTPCHHVPMSPCHHVPMLPSTPCHHVITYVPTSEGSATGTFLLYLQQIYTLTLKIRRAVVSTRVESLRTRSPVPWGPTESISRALLIVGPPPCASLFIHLRSHEPHDRSPFFRWSMVTIEPQPPGITCVGKLWGPMLRHPWGGGMRWGTREALYTLLHGLRVFPTLLATPPLRHL